MMFDYPLFIYILGIEFLILVVLIFSLAFHRSLFYILNIFYRKRKKILSDYFFTLIDQKLNIDLNNFPGKKRWRRELLEVAESYNLKIKGEDWEKTKKEISTHFLIQYARKWARSFSWKKRNFAARVFNLFPFQEDEEMILKLMNDPEFIVRSPASSAAISLQSEKGIHKALYSIAHDEGYSFYFYQDLLVQNPDKVFEKVIEFAKDPDIHGGALRVLGSHTWSKPIPFLKDDLESPDPVIRRLGYKVLLNNEYQNRQEYFIKGLLDADEEVVLQSIRGIALYDITPHLQKLKEFLENRSWTIRLASARALMKEGKEGPQILKNETNATAREVAKYVMDFG